MANLSYIVWPALRMTLKMPKKQNTQEDLAEGIFVIAAKTIGKAAGKIASVITRSTTTNEEPKPPQLFAKKKAPKVAKPKVAKKRVATQTKKAVRKRSSK